MKSSAALEVIQLTIGDQYMVMEKKYADKKTSTDNSEKYILADTVDELVTKDQGAIQEENDDKLEHRTDGYNGKIKCYFCERRYLYLWKMAGTPVSLPNVVLLIKVFGEN